MTKEKRSIKSVLAITLLILQVIFVFLPTVSIDKIYRSTAKDTIDVVSGAHGTFSSMGTLYEKVVDRSQMEKKLEYKFENNAELQSQHADVDEYLDVYYERYYHDADLDDDKQDTTASLLFKIFLLLIPMIAGFFFLIWGFKTEENSLFFAISASIFVATSFITMFVMSDFESALLKSNSYLERGITVFGWLSIIALLAQWALFFVGGFKQKKSARKERHNSSRPRREPPFKRNLEQDDALRCSACGTKLSADSPTCPRCGKTNTTN